MADEKLFAEIDDERITQQVPPSAPPPVAIPDSAPAVGSEALSGTGSESREIMPVAEETVSRDSFASELPDKPMPTPYETQVQQDETVAGNLKQLLSEDSEYLEQGRQEGLKFAAERGLQNSTLAAQAGEQARISAAMPIAQQDASTRAQRAELNQNTVNSFRLNEMDHMQSMIERAQQGDINAQLQLDQYGFNSALSAQQNIERMREMALAGDIQAQQNYLAFTYDTIMAGIAQGYALELNDQEFQQAQSILMQEYANALGLSEQAHTQELERLNQSHQNTLEEIAARADAATTEQEANLSFQLQANYLAQVAARQQAASEEIRIIMQTEGLSATQQAQALQQAQSRMRADVEALQAYYAQSPQWDDSFGGDVTPATPTTGGGSTGNTTVPANQGYQSDVIRDFDGRGYYNLP